MLASFVALAGCSASSEGPPSPANADAAPPAESPGSDAGTTPIAPVPPNDPVEPGAVAGPCPADELAADLERHSCFHIEHGPYADVATSAESTAPSVSKPHTAFTVDVKAGEDRWLSFTAKSTNVYAFYSGPKARIVLRRDGQRVPLTCEGPTTDACLALPYQVLAELTAGETVTVALFPESEATEPIKLVIEAVE